MEGETEYAFWHVLARDVAYGQIPRASRASRHVAAAAWIESKAPERLEDLADVLAYHYTTALELAEAAGDSRTGWSSSGRRRSGSSRSPANVRSGWTPRGVAMPSNERSPSPPRAILNARAP